jgi:hypothetical protein
MTKLDIIGGLFLLLVMVFCLISCVLNMIFLPKIQDFRETGEQVTVIQIIKEFDAGGAEELPIMNYTIILDKDTLFSHKNVYPKNKFEEGKTYNVLNCKNEKIYSEKDVPTQEIANMYCKDKKRNIIFIWGTLIALLPVIMLIHLKRK